MPTPNHDPVFHAFARLELARALVMAERCACPARELIPGQPETAGLAFKVGYLCSLVDGMAATVERLLAEAEHTG